MTVVTPKFGMGASVLRREDAAFIQKINRQINVWIEEMDHQPLSGDVAEEKENCLGYCQSEDTCRYESPEELTHTLPIGLPVGGHGQK